MFIKKLLSPELESEPHLKSEATYNKYRINISIFLSVWTVVAVFLLMYWRDLDGWLKYSLSVLAFIFAPDFTSIKDIFTSYQDAKQNLSDE